MRSSTVLRQVHAAGGGINFTVRAVRETSEDILLRDLLTRLDTMMRSGTTTCEIKTGYGLDFDTEVKMLRVINRARALHKMRIFATFLVHAVPKGRTSGEVTNDIVENQLPKLAELVNAGSFGNFRSQDEDSRAVHFIDVFCEHGPSFFTPDQSQRILARGKELLGVEAAFHGDELSDQGCGQLAAAVGARSVSHLEMLNTNGISAMAAAGVHAVLLPTTAYLLRLPAPPARALIDAGAPVALASDFNPNAFCCDMPTVMNLACVTFGLTMAESLVASTINAASALGVAANCGSLEIGKDGDLLLLDAPSWEHLVYNMRPPVAEVFRLGRSVTKSHGAARRVPLYSGGEELEQSLSTISAGVLGAFSGALPPRFDYDGPDGKRLGLPHAPKRPVKLSPQIQRQVGNCCSPLFVFLSSTGALSQTSKQLRRSHLGHSECASLLSDHVSRRARARLC